MWNTNMILTFFCFESEIPVSGKLIPSYQSLSKFSFKLLKLILTSFVLANYFKHGTIIRTRMTCKKITK